MAVYLSTCVSKTNWDFIWPEFTAFRSRWTRCLAIHKSCDLIYVSSECMQGQEIWKLIRCLQNKEILQSVLHWYSNLLSRQLQSVFRRLLTVHPSWRIKKWKLKFVKFSIEIKNFIAPLKSVSDLTREFIYRYESAVNFWLYWSGHFCFGNLRSRSSVKSFCQVPLNPLSRQWIKVISIQGRLGVDFMKLKVDGTRQNWSWNLKSLQ